MEINKIQNIDKIISVDSAELIPKNKKDTRCAPGIKFDAGSCIELSLLIEMAKAYNKDVGADSIILFNNLDTLNPRKYKKYLVKEFGKKLQNKCTTQKCWTEQTFITNMKKLAKDELQKYTFRPDGPNGKFEWLNTIHINDVMDQYQKKDKSFKFLGAVPIDFNDFDRFGIRNLNYKNLINNGIYKLGIVFNLDKHNESGSHWVSLYSDLKMGQVYFFDSNGVRPVERIRTLMRKITNFIENYTGNKRVNVDHNKIQHQYENSECGVYSMNFIIRMLSGKETFEEICKSKVPDKKINKCRNKYFVNTNV